MSNTDQMILIYVTFPNLKEAKSVARLIVEEKLAACANILPVMHSIYEWEGRLQEENEVVALIKTGLGNQQAITRRILEVHSYAIPAIVVIEARSGNPDFLNWVEEQSTA